MADSSNEPDYIAQIGDITTAEQYDEWVKRTVEDARAKGMKCGRFSQHQSIKNLHLYEGWKARPDDQGEPRFQLTAAQQT